MVVHRGGVGEGQHQPGGDAAARAGGAEDVGPLVAGVARRPRAGAAPGPDPGERSLLADPRLVLEPDLERPAARGLGDRCGYRLAKVFLKAACASGTAFGWCGRSARQAKASGRAARAMWSRTALTNFDSLPSG